MTSSVNGADIDALWPDTVAQATALIVVGDVLIVGTFPPFASMVPAAQDGVDALAGPQLGDPPVVE